MPQFDCFRQQKTARFHDSTDENPPSQLVCKGERQSGKNRKWTAPIGGSNYSARSLDTNAAVSPMCPSISRCSTPIRRYNCRIETAICHNVNNLIGLLPFRVPFAMVARVCVCANVEWERHGILPDVNEKWPTPPRCEQISVASYYGKLHFSS